MADTLVIGGQPDWFQLLSEWSDHGREITAGDAEKALDLSPSVTYRAPSSFSGEFFFAGSHSNTPLTDTPTYGVCAITHNLADIDAKARFVMAGSGARRAPDGTVGSTNTSSDHSNVDEDPYGTIADWATPTTTTSDWDLEVSFANSSTLYTGVEDSQIIVVVLRQQGTYGATQSANDVLIQVKEGVSIRASKNIEAKLENDLDTIAVNVLVDPTDFTDQTLDGMSVKVSADAGSGVYWQIGSIGWIRLTDSSVAADTGWITAEQPSQDLFHMSSDVPNAFVLPFLDANDEAINSGTNPDIPLVFLTWDDTGSVGSGKQRIFKKDENNPLVVGTLTSWRPEIGVIAAGPAYGTNRVPLSTVSFGSRPNSLLFESKGGNTWSVRRQPRRVVSATMQGISGSDFIDDVYAVLRRADRTQPLAIAVDPSSASPNIRAAASIYGRLTSLRSTPRSAEGDSRHFDVSMSFEEVV